MQAQMKYGWKSMSLVAFYNSEKVESADQMMVDFRVIDCKGFAVRKCLSCEEWLREMRKQ